LDVFAPDNVYSAAGSRLGMVPLFEGAFDYDAFLADLACDSRLEASLEWFGDDVMSTLSHDRHAIEQLSVAGRFGAAERPSADRRATPNRERLAV
jgi:3-dehydroshikimate dehydratase